MSWWKPARLELAGTYLTGTDQAALLLVSGGTPAWLWPGELIDGWRIEATEEEQVRLRKGARIKCCTCVRTSR
jgi:hypothetical protein